MGNNPGTNPEEDIRDECEECDGHSTSRSDSNKTQKPSSGKENDKPTDAGDSVGVTISVGGTTETPGVNEKPSANKDNSNKQSDSSTGKRSENEKNSKINLEKLEKKSNTFRSNNCPAEVL